MELQLAITSNEVLEHQRNYRNRICESPSVRQSELAWVAGRIVYLLSASNQPERRDGRCLTPSNRQCVALLRRSISSTNQATFHFN